MKFFVLRILNKLGLLSKLNINAKLVLNDRKFTIPIIKAHGYNNLFMTEIWMIELLKILTEKENKDTLFIDIGVNIGQTLLKLRSVTKEMKYIGFEPNPLCVFYVNELISANSEIKKSNSDVYPIGISTDNEILTLNLYFDNQMDAAASIIEEFRTEEIKHKFMVPVFNPNTINKNELLKGTSIIKIDVEGAELEVLESLKEVINSERPSILIEILPVHDKSNEFRINRQIKIESLFKEVDYTIYRIEKSNENKFSHLTKITTIGIHSDIKLCDYLILPNENTNYTSLVK